MRAAPPWGLINVTAKQTVRNEQRPPPLLAPSNAREQHDGQGEEAENEAGVEVGPDQENDGEPWPRLRAAERGVEDECPAEERIELRAHVEEWRCHRQTEGRRAPACQAIAGEAHQEPEEDQPRGDDHEPLPVRQALQSERVRPEIQQDVREPRVVQPVPPGRRVAEGIRRPDGTVLDDPLPARDVPPQVTALQDREAKRPERQARGQIPRGRGQPVGSRPHDLDRSASVRHEPRRGT